MANEGSPNTNGSQFWFCPAENCTLHKKFVVFGMLESVFEVLEKIENVKTLASVPEKVIRAAATLAGVVCSTPIYLLGFIHDGMCSWRRA